MMPDIAPVFDIFVTYSRLESFRPGGSNSQQRDHWPTSLKQALERALPEALASKGREVGRTPTIYVYEDRAVGEIWQPNVRSVCRSTVLLAIVSETYFRSKTCFLEWFAFTTGHPEFGAFADIALNPNAPIVPVWRLEADEASLGSISREVLEQSAQDAMAEAFATDGPGFPQAKVQELTRAWVRAIFDANGEDLSEFSDAGPNQFSKGNLKKAIQRIAGGIAAHLSLGERSIEEEKLLALSVLGLGLDRFNLGGWGFSMGSDFERDVDGRLLTHGRYELNLLVLRALQWAVARSGNDGKRAYKQENKAALLWSLAESSSSDLAGSPVTDRKRRAVALSALLRSINGPLRDDLVRELPALDKEMGHKPFSQRWVVQQNAPRADYDTVVFFELASRAHAAIREDSFIADNLCGEEVASAYEAASKMLREWLLSNDLIGTLKDKVFAPLADTSTVAKLRGGHLEHPGLLSDYEQHLLTLHLRMLSDIPDSARTLGSLADMAPKLKAIGASLEKILHRVKSADCPESYLRAFLQVFPLYCLSIVDTAHHYQEKGGIVEHAALCSKYWIDLVNTLGATSMVRAMNAAGWAATILLAERRGVNVDATVLASIWKAAEAARGARKEVAIEAVQSSPLEARLKFDEFVRQQVDKIAKDLGLDWSDPNALRMLFSFGGNGKVPTTGPQVTIGDAVGLLMVDPITDQVLSATAGFNEMYIEPFSARLGIGLNSLERMIYELGKTDSEFVESLSHSVVLRCWPFDRVGAEIVEAVRFDERTKLVQQSVIAGPVGKSCRDLLQLRTGDEEKTRYVLRTCSTVHRDDLVGVAPANLLAAEEASKRIVLWTYVDITSWMPETALGVAGRIAHSA